MKKPYLLLTLSACLILAGCGDKVDSTSSSESNGGVSSSVSSLSSSLESSSPSKETSSESSKESVASSESSSEESSSSESESSQESSSESVNSSESSESSNETPSNGSVAKYDFSALEYSKIAMNAAAVKELFDDPTYLSSGKNIVSNVTGSGYSKGYEVNESLTLPGLKVGAKATKGSLTLSLSENVSKVSLTFMCYTSKTDMPTVTVGDASVYTCAEADFTTPKTQEFVLSEATASLIISVKYLAVFSVIEFF